MDRPSLQTFSIHGALLAVLFLAVPMGEAAAQAPAPEKPSPTAPSLDAASTAFKALPEAERKALQDALIWTTAYSGNTDGTFGRQTYDAIVSLQANAQAAPSGILSPKDRTTLLGNAKRAKELAGFTVLDDPRSGVRIGVPTKVLVKQDVNPNGGSRWQSADGKVTLDTRTAPPDATLQALYDRNIAIRTPGRVITYKILRPDFYVIAGETPTGKFYSRYASGPAGIRAFSIGYDKTLAAQVDRFVVAIANSFVPFPTTPAPAIAAQNQAPLPQQAPQQPQAKLQRQRLIGTGWVVSPRQIVTTAPLAACKDVQVQGLKPQQVKGNGVLLLEFAEDLKAKPVAIANGGMEEGSALLIAAYTEMQGDLSLAAMPAEAAGPSTVSAALQPGASGAAVLDQRRALVGLIGSVPTDQRKIAGVATTANYQLVPVTDLGHIVPSLAQSGKELAGKRLSAAALMSSLQNALVPITCAP